ncbi:hypothetical protein [Nostoc sp. 'Lobaria pulmonaria (5183) cyanobiont']|jgi:hypothetical protein|uniref:hypothetical protein n=1 Tax=Nostoc sp. 'Lobaria pulmonaria (5183) cyanobiont' TaxID=1618022 RepID=UPI000CF31470|nr:hypothetical protein [Nostoc sp. 'Lobaria pulmonaria (5183) cyanobiont']
MLTRRTRDRYALGVGGSYGQGDYWLGQLDPVRPQKPLRCADSEPRVLKPWKDALTTGSDHLTSQIGLLSIVLMPNQYLYDKILL